MIIERLKRINNELDDEYHNERFKMINKYPESLIKIHDLDTDGVYLDELMEFIDQQTFEMQDLNILFPLFPMDPGFIRFIKRFTDQEIDYELEEKVRKLDREIKAEMKAKELGIFDEIQQIKDITDDEEYKKAIYDLFRDIRLDKDRYPKEIGISYDIEKLMKRKESDFDHDLSLINQAQNEAQKDRNKHNNWENYFIEIEYLIQEVTDEIELLDSRFIDYTPSQLYERCDIQVKDHKKKDEFNEALIKLYGKYKNFKKVGRVYRIFNPDYESINGSNSKDKPNYHIKPNTPFYLLDEDYFGKQATSIKKFLTDSKKVTLDPDMQLIPFRIKSKSKNTFYFLTIDNLSEDITLNFVNTGFKYINRQSNLYYQIQSAIKEELRKDYDNFEEYILKEIRSSTGFNNRLLKNLYEQPSGLLNSKFIITLHSEAE